MSTSSMNQSQSSLSPSTSQSHPQPQDISLDDLVLHLLAAKRSLTSIKTVWRANEIVTSAHSSLEESVKLAATTGFLQNGITEQAKSLRKVRQCIEHTYNQGQKDFKAVIRTLDGANSRLEATMNILRSTMVEAALRPADEDPKSLLHFVDEDGVETMRDALKESIRDSREAQTLFDSSILSFDDDLRALKSAMSSAATTSPSHSNTSVSKSQQPIPENLQALEANAQEMASLLQSLVQHFDLCVTAIRHTEGGYAAVRNAASNLPPGAEPVSVSGVMNVSQSLDEEGPPTDEERREMLGILENDASQVEDVVMELRERLNDMESRYEVIQDHVSNLTNTFHTTLSAFSVLETINSHLPGYLIASSEFKLHWEETKSVIQDQLEELENMRVFYEKYHASYDGLLLEVHRRKQDEERIQHVVKKATEQINKIREADMRERDAFRGDAGDFLPGDLWDGVSLAAPKWEFTQVDGDGVKVDSPELSRSVVEAAAKRDRERQRQGKL